jgi:3D (Asp-Asp-Asp) domain-containing protein
LKIGRHRVRPRFFVILVALLAILGGCMYDKQAQRGQAGTTAGTIQEERTVYGYEEAQGRRTAFTGTGTDAEGTGLLEPNSQGEPGTMSEGGRSRPTEPGNSQSVEEARSGPVSVSRGSSRWDTGDHINAGIFTVTAYTAGYESTGKRPGDKGYGEPAISGSKYADFEKVIAKKDHTIAADWEVLPPGTKVLIEGLSGTYVVEDKGAVVRGKHIDLYIPDLQEAKAWGVQRRKIIILEMGVL